MVEGALNDGGRVLVRYSGTSPLIRIMVEGRDEDSIRHLAQEIAATIELTLGKGA